MLRRNRETQGLPVGDIGALDAAVRRTTILRIALGAALTALLAVAFVLALNKDAQADAFFPPDRSGIIVADFSASVSPLTYRRIGRALRRIAAANEPVGMVVFSDAAYELFPPGTPGKELAPLLRYFQPLPGTRRSAFEAQFPRNPWQGSFAGGTRISEGLNVARLVLERDDIDNATVLLISDLEAPQSDRARIADMLTRLQTEGVAVRIVSLFAQPQNRAFFADIVGPDAFVAEASLVKPIEADELGLGGTMPWLYLGLGGLLVAALVANERWNGRLLVPWRVAA